MRATHRVNMDKFVEGFKFLNTEQLISCRFFRSGDHFYIIKPLGKSSDSTLIWEMNLGKTQPKITLEYKRFDDKSKMPSKKIWHKKEINIHEFIQDVGYNPLALESFYGLTVTTFLFEQIRDGFIVVVKPSHNRSVNNGGLPIRGRGMCDRSNENKRI